MLTKKSNRKELESEMDSSQNQTKNLTASYWVRLGSLYEKTCLL